MQTFAARERGDAPLGALTFLAGVFLVLTHLALPLIGTAQEPGKIARIGLLGRPRVTPWSKRSSRGSTSSATSTDKTSASSIEKLPLT